MKIKYTPEREPDMYDDEDNGSEDRYSLRLPEIYAVGPTLLAALERMVEHLELEIFKINRSIGSVDLDEVSDALEFTPQHEAQIIHCSGWLHGRTDADGSPCPYGSDKDPWGLTGEIKVILHEKKERLIAIAKSSPLVTNS